MSPLQAAAREDLADFTVGEFLANLFCKHCTVSFATPLFFCWAMEIQILKLRTLQHRRKAFLFGVLPAELGQETNAQNVGKFIDQRLPPFNLLNRFMVNRIRKVLEFFEGVL